MAYSQSAAQESRDIDKVITTKLTNMYKDSNLFQVTFIDDNTQNFYYDRLEEIGTFSNAIYPFIVNKRILPDNIVKKIIKHRNDNIRKRYYPSSDIFIVNYGSFYNRKQVKIQIYYVNSWSRHLFFDDYIPNLYKYFEKIENNLNFDRENNAFIDSNDFGSDALGNGLKVASLKKRKVASLKKRKVASLKKK